MHMFQPLLLLSTVSAAAAQQVYQGFNSGALKGDNTPKDQSDFEDHFNTARNIQNSPGLFSSVRLFTNIQGGTTADPSSAFPAAIATNTSILLGIWASGTNNLTNELTALSRAFTQYGTNLTNLVVGLSVGSEDLYRNSESGARNDAGVGQDPDTITDFINQVRRVLSNTTFSELPIGHVDSWSAWANSSNSAVIDAVDFVGVDIYPYYEDTEDNSFSRAVEIFHDRLNQTTTAAGSKSVWITETGWPVSGPNFGNATASVENAQSYWQQIGCSLFGRNNTWWFTLEDDNTGVEARFGITDNDSTRPNFNLTCPADSGAPATINVNTNPSGNAAGHHVLSQALLGFVLLLTSANYLF